MPNNKKKRARAVPLWSGGFAEGMHPALARISDSLAQDMPLADCDLRASAVYAEALARCGVLSAAQGKRLATALGAMRRDLQHGRWVPAGAEDVHTAIEAEVTQRVGALGERLHTGRSRNDQVSTALRLCAAERLAAICTAVRGLQQVLCRRAAAAKNILMPAYTHMQRAQPISLAQFLMAHFWPLARDVGRLRAARAQALQCPLGVGAVSGHPFGLDRTFVARRLGFFGVTPNSLDTVGDRDFVAEALFACSLLAVHLSRLGEDLVLFSTTEFGFVRWPDDLASGSSLMPNKKNPDLAELVRGRAAAGVGDLVTLLTLLKGLPSSYQRDLQEDKPPLWRGTAQALHSVVAMQAALAGIEFDRGKLTGALSDDLLATEVADAMVRRGVPFRAAHHGVAQCARAARERGVPILHLLDLDDFVLPKPLLARDFAELSARAAVARRRSAGGTAAVAVTEQLKEARAWLRKGAP